MIRTGLVTLGLLICAKAFADGYFAGEDIRSNGDAVLFELAPVDPRELFLGDYMTLRYDLGGARRLIDDTEPRPLDGAPDQGLAVYTLEDGVARIVGYSETVDGVETGFGFIRYRMRNGRPTIGGERYYFQSGTGERYEEARYGVFRVMPDGRALLAGLADEKKRPIAVAGEAPSSEGVAAD